MGLDVGKVTIKHLPRPAGLANDFAWQLAEKARKPLNKPFTTRSDIILGLI
jgi:hypothetical protein